jgi:demethoxyubiquinone hydroxylase (CLK1/Coq7/Cat5 family)
MNFSGEITAGNIMTAVAFAIAVMTAFHGLKSKLDLFAALMERMEARHEQRLTKLETNERTLTGLVQQLIGQNEERVRWDGLDRRESHDRRQERGRV